MQFAGSLCADQHSEIMVVNVDVFSVLTVASRSRSRTVPSKKHQPLAVALGNLPLALLQAVAYIDALLSKVPHRAFGEAYKERCSC